MNRRVLAFASLIAASLPAAARASEGAGPGTDFWVYLVDFLIVAVPVGWLLAPYARRALASRHDAVKAELEEAKARFDEAEGRLRLAEERLANLNQEMERLLEEFRHQGQVERDTLAHEGAVLSEKIRAEADFRLEQAVKMARAELADAVVAKAFGRVEGRLAAKASAPLADPVVDRMVAEIGNRPS